MLEFISSDIRPSRFKHTYGGLLINGRHRVRLDLVHLDTGTVMRHDYVKPLPNWLNEPLLRAIALSTREVPIQTKPCVPAS